jgi:hypothetical protein
VHRLTKTGFSFFILSTHLLIEAVSLSNSRTTLSAASKAGMHAVHLRRNTVVHTPLPDTFNDEEVYQNSSQPDSRDEIEVALRVRRQAVEAS